MRFLSTLAFVCVSFCAQGAALADCKGTESDTRPMVIDKVDGWWVRRGLFDCITRELEMRRGVMDSYAEYQMIAETSLREYRMHLKLEKRATERAIEALNMAKSELNESDAWYKSPVLWFAVGVVVSSAATVAVGSVVK